MRGGLRLLGAQPLCGANRRGPASAAALHHLCVLRRQTYPTLPQRRTRFTLAGAGSSTARIAGTAGNVLIIGSALTLFGYIMHTLYDNLIAESGVTRVYNESLDLLRANPQIRELLGDSVAGFGEPTHSQRQRQRAITHRNFMDAQGRQRLYMQYYVEDSRKRSPYMGVAKVDLAESKSTGSWDYNYIVVDLYLPEQQQQQQQQQQHAGTRSVHKGDFASRVEVLVTDEFAREIRQQESRRRGQRFAVPSREPPDGSWFSALHPTSWRK